MDKSLNTNLHKAKKLKKDEFYTQLTDIEKELKHYKKHFKNKVVLCNCDDPRVSNFFHYFAFSFERLGLKKLITTCYKNQNADLFSQHNTEKAIYIEYKRDKNGQLISYPKYVQALSQEPLYKGEKDNPNIPNPDDIGIGQLEGDGDFRSPESIEFLKQADIVVTNPPFSLFREYVAQLIEHDKKFVIIGNVNAITYKETFKLIKENKLWLGYNCTRHFKRPDGSMYETARSFWYTNLDIAKRCEDLILYKKYNKTECPQYDNYDAINIDKVSEIPIDYEGVMGVPITFLDKYNPDQFEVVGSDYCVKEGLLPDIIKKGWKGKVDRGYLDGKRLYSRLLIRNKKVFK